MSAPPLDATPFRWLDGERVVVFGRGTLGKARELIGPDYVVVSTERASAAAPELLEDATAVHAIGPGRVDELAGELRSRVEGSVLVALGGGRVIDVAKALAAADPPRTVAAIPTTLSGAEMTPVHRQASGAPAGASGVRPAIVVNDPAVSASQPVPQLAESAGNALGHAIEGPVTPLHNPVAALAALNGVCLIAAGFEGDAPGEDDRDRLALGALLCAYAISSTGYGLHHVSSQTLARFAGVGHGAANTIMLPHSIAALRRRASGWIDRLEQALGSDPADLARRLQEVSGAASLREAGVSEEQLELCAEQAAQRPELQMTPPPADLDELRALYQAAY